MTLKFIPFSKLVRKRNFHVKKKFVNLLKRFLAFKFRNALQHTLGSTYSDGSCFTEKMAQFDTMIDVILHVTISTKAKEEENGIAF